MSGSNTVYISGASSGIGMACAKAYAERGCRLVLAARRLERLEKLKADLERMFTVEVYVASLDVRDSEAVAAFVGSIPGALADIDILVNNAGLSRGLAPIQEGELQDWEEMIDTNLKGLLYLTRQILPGMIARGRGHVVNIGSVAGQQVYPGGNVYCATKFAVRALTEGLKMDLLGTPVRVTTVDPGMVETEFSLVRYRGDVERAARTYKGLTPLQPEDIADAVVYATSRPAHVNISEMILWPVDQASVYHTHRRL
ncbi:MAG: SDR family oxidoreductase [Calditrichaeota bacterium]|nr:SDR family oxidoreductase [Calditrichota bacterium]